jgi:hypothetical protein
MILQIGFIISVILGCIITAEIPPSSFIVVIVCIVIETAFFCRIFFTDSGTGLVPMILIIAWSVLCGGIGVVTGIMSGDASGLLLGIGYIIGNAVPAILAFVCKE